MNEKRFIFKGFFFFFLHFIYLFYIQNCTRKMWFHLALLILSLWNKKKRLKILNHVMLAKSSIRAIKPCLLRNVPSTRVIILNNKTSKRFIMSREIEHRDFELVQNVLSRQCVLSFLPFESSGIHECPRFDGNYVLRVSFVFLVSELPQK